jgi:acetyl esterase/lipase
MLGFLLSVVPGCLMVGSGVMMLLTPGDLRISQFAAGGGVIGVVIAIPILIFADFGSGLVLILASAASYLAGGFHTLRLEPHPKDVPLPGSGLQVVAEVGIDETILATWTVMLPIALGRDSGRIAAEVSDAKALFEAEGWSARPATYFESPPPLTSPRLTARSQGSLDFEHLSFESSYEPRAAEPGRDRWLDRPANRTAHAWVLRHRDGPRPTLVCIHGYQMGSPRVDIPAFEVARLHHDLGLDVVLPILPLHGPRKAGRISGDGYLSGDMLDTLHAEAQAIWDMRRIVSWLRAEGAPAIGLHGLSLGGYNAALLSCIEDDLACVIGGIPAVDFSRLVFRHGPPLQVRQIEVEGLETSDIDAVLHPVSPLAQACRVVPEGRSIYAGIADRIVPAEQVADLWRHWGRPPIEWYPGGHCTFMAHPGVRALVDRTLRERLLA